MALMAFSDSEVLKTCSNSCLKKYETLKNQYDTLRVEYNKTEFDLANYKRGLASIEEQLAFYKKNEILFCKQIVVLKRDASFSKSEVTALKAQIENLKKEKECNKIKIDNFDNASKCLDKLIGSQLADNNRKGNGVNKSVTENTFEIISSGPIIEDWVSDCDEIEFKERVEKDECVKPKTEQANKPRKDNQIPKINRTNLNEKTTSKPGIGFQVTKRVCFVCGSLSHLIKDCDYHEKRMAKKIVINKKVEKDTGSGVDRPVWNKVQRLNHYNQFVPRVVLTRTGKIPVNTARTNSTNQVSTARLNPKGQAVLTSGAKKVNTVRPKVNESRPKHVLYKAHSPFRRPFHQITAPKNRNLDNKVSTASVKLVSTASVKSVSTANVKLVSAANIKSINGKRVISAVRKQRDNAGKSSACWIWRPTEKVIDHGDPHVALKDTGIFDSGCSRHMIGNKSYLTDYQDYDGGFVAFGGSSKRGKISGKGTIRTGKLDFEDVYFVKELKFNLFSVSQMCDRKNNFLFTETECLILSPEFKLPDENQVMLKIPRKDNMYSFDLKNVVPTNGLTCLFAKATNDESKLWHRRLGHVNFKTLNKLMKANLVRGLPSKIFENDHTCVACQKGKQHKATCKTKSVNYVCQPLQILHMDLFGSTFVKSLMGKMYCLVVTDDYSRFSWVFFLAKKDKTSGILKEFITRIENQLDHKVKIIRSDNGTEFKNHDLNQLCGIKGIKSNFG
ncbi:putative ribonuclease H-like domain-containing protein [Tanacetum coccineum]